MNLRLYDTATRSVRRFVPIDPARVSIYVCGATVQGPPHVGHVRSGVAFDVLARWLRAGGTQVVLCRNVTDIDDKILARALLEDRPWWAVAADYERSFSDAYDALGCLRPTIEPRATGHIPQMVELIDRLIERDHAYAAEGDVYFSVKSFPRYGQLSGQRPDEMQSSEDAGPKRDPRDFALWKSTRPEEPAWSTPWGRGRPGWHIECSAMAVTYLGPEFDIHGGGRDLQFPHHENEIAQAQAAGDGFAHYWMHNGWVTTAGEKMSKSLGNSLLVHEVIRRVRPVELRWYLASAHYRSTIEFSDRSLAESAAGYRRLETFVLRAAEMLGEDIEAAPGEPAELRAAVPGEFATAMDDDVNVPAAIAVLHDRVTGGNQSLGSGDGAGTAAALGEVRAMLTVLGADPLSPPWRGAGRQDEAPAAALAHLVGEMLAERDQARRERDFTTADAIRGRLAAAGVAIADTSEGARWHLERGER